MTKQTVAKYKELYKNKLVFIPDKYVERNMVLCKIENILETTGLFQLKDFNGNKYEFSKKEICFPTEEELNIALIKHFMKPGLIIYVDESELSDFVFYLETAGYNISKKYEIGTYFLDFDGLTVHNNTKTNGWITFSTIRNRVLGKGAIGIEPFMVAELNEILRIKYNSAIKILLVQRNISDLCPNKKDNYSYNVCELVLRNANMLSSYIISPTDELVGVIEDYFITKGVCRLSFNNTRTRFNSSETWHNR